MRKVSLFHVVCRGAQEGLQGVFKYSSNVVLISYYDNISSNLINKYGEILFVSSSRLPYTYSSPKFNKSCTNPGVQVKQSNVCLRHAYLYHLSKDDRIWSSEWVLKNLINAGFFIWSLYFPLISPLLPIGLSR